MAGKQISHWPAWYYGPGGASRVFNSFDEVPAGWFPPEEKHNIVEPEAPKPADGEDSWGGFTKDFLAQALRKKGETIFLYQSARQMFERAVSINAIPGYGPTDFNE